MFVVLALLPEKLWLPEEACRKHTVVLESMKLLNMSEE
jgi:hypothetical protein